MYTIIKTSELPLKIKQVLDTIRVCKEVNVQAGTEFIVGRSHSDYCRASVTVINLETDQIKTVHGGYSESYLNFTPQEHALYTGIKVPIPNPDIWIIETMGRKNRITVMCHPDCISQLLPAELGLTRTQKIVLQITRQYISSYKKDALRSFKLTLKEWEATKLELQNLGLMMKNGALTTAGKNAATNCNINHWEV